MMTRLSTFGDFTCRHCGGPVSAMHALSGVHNRNHCPYCLWSLHLDLFAAGDRLSACKSPMRPVALTVKPGHNKYSRVRGELMLVHLCAGCGTASINRIAADDDPETLMRVFGESHSLPARTLDRFRKNGIVPLQAEDRPLVWDQLFGRDASVSVFD